MNGLVFNYTPNFLNRSTFVPIILNFPPFDQVLILAHAAKQNSFGVSYLAPWTPIRGIELLDTVLRRPLWMPKRPSTVHPTDAVRYREEGAEIGYGKKEEE